MTLSPRFMKFLAVLCYVLGMAGSGAFAVRVLLLGLDLNVEFVRLPSLWASLLDLALLLLFGLQHSGMARASFKVWWTRLIPRPLERSVYVAASGVVTLVLALGWQNVDDVVWWRGPRWLVVLPLLAGIVMVLVNLRFDHAELFGLRQAWAGDQPEPPETLVIAGPYRYIRHPLMTCLLLFLWTQPIMTTTLALLNGGMTLYIVIGLYFEERDLAERFYPHYAAYRRRVPALIPWRPPLSTP